MYCRLAEDLSAQITKKIGPQFVNCHNLIRKSSKSANFRICDLRILFADRPMIVFLQVEQ